MATCECGCGQEGEYLMTGYDYDRTKPDGKGEKFVDEPACVNAVLYCRESAQELGLPFSARRIAAEEN